MRPGPKKKRTCQICDKFSSYLNGRRHSPPSGQTAASRQWVIPVQRLNRSFSFPVFARRKKFALMPKGLLRTAILIKKFLSFDEQINQKCHK